MSGNLLVTAKADFGARISLHCDFSEEASEGSARTNRTWRLFPTAAALSHASCFREVNYPRFLCRVLNFASKQRVAYRTENLRYAILVRLPSSTQNTKLVSVTAITN